MSERHFSCACGGIVGGLLVNYVEEGSSRKEEDYFLEVSKLAFHSPYSVVG